MKPVRIIVREQLSIGSFPQPVRLGVEVVGILLIMQEYDEHQILKTKKLSFDFSRLEKPTSKAKNKRASLIEPFVKRLQSDAKRAGYKPMTTARICDLMAYIDTDDLHYFHKKLCDSPCYGGIWDWYVVAKDLNKK